MFLYRNTELAIGIRHKERTKEHSRKYKTEVSVLQGCGIMSLPNWFQTF
jgi:hypothetical protein